SSSCIRLMSSSVRLGSNDEMRIFLAVLFVTWDELEEIGAVAREAPAFLIVGEGLVAAAIFLPAALAAGFGALPDFGRAGVVFATADFVAGFTLDAGLVLPEDFDLAAALAGVALRASAGFFDNAPLRRPSRPLALFALAAVVLRGAAVLDFAAFFVVIGSPLVRTYANKSVAHQ